MGKNIDFTKPLSEEDEEWLRSRSRGYEVDEHKRRLEDAERAKEAVPVEEAEWEPSNRMAPESFEEPGPNPRQVPFPVGVDGEHVDRSASSGSAQSEEPAEEVDVDDLTVDELKDELRARDLPVGGNKDELVKRLREAEE